MWQIRIPKDLCCGCGACAAVCKTGAVRMSEGELGFLYPHIQRDKCLDCGRCADVCPVGRKGKGTACRQQYYAGQHRDRKIRIPSSSGGVFSALAQAVLREGGVVYGVCFDREWNVVHGSSQAYALSAMRGSKYIQSDNRKAYEAVAGHLRTGKTVLYTGTPCQCQGILQYVQMLGLDQSRLFLMDFVCHGVGSPSVWKQYVNWLESRKGKMRYFSFRDKTDGWERYQSRAINWDGEDMLQDGASYFRMYQSMLITRSSCFHCSYTSYERCSDLTVGDFWNIGDEKQKFDAKSGISQILVNTKKGAWLLKAAAEDLHLVPCQKRDCWQPHLEYPAKCPAGRKRFLAYYNKHTFSDVLKKYGKGTRAARCRGMAVRVARKTGLYVFAAKSYQIVNRMGKGGR